MTAPKIGYLLPTRERIMGGAPETGPMLALAERAEALGYDSIWIGDSLLARPRHDPLTLMAAVAARTRRVGRSARRYCCRRSATRSCSRTRWPRSTASPRDG